MRPLLTLLFIALFATLSAQNWGKRERIKGNGNTITKDRKVSGFTGIKACCSFTVEVSKGAPSVRVEAESNLQEYIRTDVSSGQLSIRYSQNVNISNHKPVRIYVTMKELDYVSASSSSTINFRGDFKGDDLEVRVSSSGKIKNLEFSGNDIRLEANSSGKLDIAGSGTYIRASANSSGKISASNCRVKRAKAGVNSGGSINLNVSDKLDANASSGGTIRYSGSPNVDSNTSSGGSIRKG